MRKKIKVLFIQAVLYNYGLELWEIDGKNGGSIIEKDRKNIG